MKLSLFGKHLLTAAIALVFSFSVHAATLILGERGQMLGASAVDVGGILYDVEFRRGSCVTLYEGCTSFPFTDQDSAIDASWALIDQVMPHFDWPLPEEHDAYYFNRSPVLGTPFRLVEDLDGDGCHLCFVDVARALFSRNGVGNVDIFDAASPQWDGTIEEQYVVWTTVSVPVPVPATGWLFVSAVLGLFSLKRRH